MSDKQHLKIAKHIKLKFNHAQGNNFLDISNKDRSSLGIIFLIISNNICQNYRPS